MSKEKQIEEMAKDLYHHTTAYNTCWEEDCAELANILYNADYRKQSEGEWIAKDNFNGRCTIANCSNCGTEKAFSVLVRIETISSLYPYCQKCGAKMKGGAEE